jgi:hypothetical protein
MDDRVKSNGVVHRTSPRSFRSRPRESGKICAPPPSILRSPGSELRPGGLHEIEDEEPEDLSMWKRGRMGRALDSFHEIFPLRIVRAGPAAIGKASSRVGRGLLRFFVRRPIVFTILLALAFAAGSCILRGSRQTARDLSDLARQVKECLTISPSVEHSLARIDENRQGNVLPVVRYPKKLIGLFEQAEREKKDVLASFEVLVDAWEAIAGEELLAIQVVSFDTFVPSVGVRVAGKVRAPVRIVESNFEEYLTHLQQIRLLILEGDGSGRGKLPFSGFKAEPATIVGETPIQEPAMK